MQTHTTRPASHLLRPLFLTTVLCLLPPGLALPAQQVTQPDLATTATTAAPASGAAAPTVNSGSSAAASAAGDEVVHLDVFNVTGARDVGYQAGDTTAGSRVRTALKDTSASISVFTEEFLNDIGATNVEDTLSYAPNVEAETEDTSFGFNNYQTRQAGDLDNRFRIRGLPMDTMFDLAPLAFPIDNYNSSRSEVASGANSILFGMGSAGGIINVTSQRASVNRNTLQVKNTIGTWTGTPVTGVPYYRATLDYNLVLVPKIMGLRLMGLYQDGSQGTNGSWRYWQIFREKRLNPVVDIHPFKNTTLSLAYEIGNLRRPTTYLWNAADGITGWLNAGAAAGLPANTGPIQYTYAGGAPAGTGQIVGASNPYYVFVDNGASGAPAVYDYRQGYESHNAINNNGLSVRLPASMSSYYYSTMGPGGQRLENFDRLSAILDQRLGPVNLQLAYLHNKSRITAYATKGNSSSNDEYLQGDPNYYISLPEYLASTGGASTIVNPNAGRQYMEDTWIKRTNLVVNDVARLSAEYSLDLGNFGRHRIIGMYEHAGKIQNGVTYDQIYVDENGRAINNPDAPTSGSNQDNYNGVVHRHYVTIGDFTTYYPGSWQDPVPTISLNGHTYRAAWVTNQQNSNYTTRAIDSYMLALQSYLLKNTLITTLGGRIDDIGIRSQQRSQITDPNDPRLLSGQNYWHEYVLNGQWGDIRNRSHFTYSAGAMWHIPWLWNRFSLFANYSSNTGAPSTNSPKVLPNGAAAPDTEGRSLDYGILIDILGTGAATLRLTRYDTRMLHDIAMINNPDLGYNNVPAIYNTLYRLNPTGGAAANGRGPMLPADYAAKPATYNAGMADTYTTGYEAEFTANITKQFTMRLTASYTNRSRENFISEIFNFFNTNIPLWMNLADPAKNGGQIYDVTMPGGRTMPLYNYLLDELYSPATTLDANGNSIRTGLLNLMLQNSGNAGSRPYKFNITASYKFTNPLLKGLKLGGSVRYSSPNKTPDPTLLAPLLTPVTPDTHPDSLMIDQSIFNDYTKMLNGNSLIFWGAFASYRTKLFGGRTTMTLQLNIDNIFNQYVFTTGQSRKSSSGIVYLRRVYANAPRTWRLTATFDF